ncbi:hypothetical protein RRG08_040036 [Elysia crispata]|uniref:Uncharacterized protein n=1 Tax=Elysia crispata TaxID=231223 RepID=A0AAE0Z871_9GAST|nr:hypothetical protein RRG08_040036 [Elysia crispata]
MDGFRTLTFGSIPSDPLNLPNSFDQLDPSDFILIQDTPVDVSLADVEDILRQVDEIPLDTRREFLPPGVSSLLDNYVARAMRESEICRTLDQLDPSDFILIQDTPVDVSLADVEDILRQVDEIPLDTRREFLQRTGRSSVTHASQERTGTARRHICRTLDQLDPSDFILIQDTPVDVSLADVEDILRQVDEIPLDTRREFLQVSLPSLTTMSLEL